MTWGSIELSGWRKGMSLALCAVLAVSFDASLIHWAADLGASVLSVLFIKSLTLVLVIGSYVLATENLSTLLTRCKKKALKYIILSSLLKGILDTSFTLAFLWTYAANVLLCYSLNPIWSAFLGWLFLRDILPFRTIVALIISTFAVALMFLPAILFGKSQGGRSQNAGNAMAILTGLSFSGFLFIARAASRECPDAPIIFAACCGSMLSLSGVLLFIASTSSALLQYDSPLFFLAIVLDGIIVGSVVVAFSIAPRYINGASIGLISLLELVLGPMWVLIFFSEVPPLFTLLGGGFILLTLLVHEYLSYIKSVEDDTDRLDDDNTSKTSSTPTKAAVLVADLDEETGAPTRIQGDFNCNGEQKKEIIVLAGNDQL